MITRSYFDFLGSGRRDCFRRPSLSLAIATSSATPRAPRSRRSLNLVAPRSTARLDTDRQTARPQAPGITWLQASLCLARSHRRTQPRRPGARSPRAAGATHRPLPAVSPRSLRRRRHVAASQASARRGAVSSPHARTSSPRRPGRRAVSARRRATHRGCLCPRSLRRRLPGAEDAAPLRLAYRFGLPNARATYEILQKFIPVLVPRGIFVQLFFPRLNSLPPR